MRIISGKFKSRKIDFPKNRLTRPMTDRTKETLFNIVGSFVFGKHVLDLFAGSGSLGLESLSRGAMDVTFVDQAPWAVSTIRKNLESLGLQSQGTILPMEMNPAIRKLEKQGQGFSLIFVDPPFQKGLVKKTLMRLDASDIVLPFAQVVVGHTQHEPLDHSELQNLKWVRTKKIGQACLSFLFRLEASNEKTKSYISGEL
ncbi:MAG TPA: 16S rRNA (guanine(966)-N(2))-methyltransferase RsmD [Candidatus Omnitrophota bacterium]|nr:16S rRNA (guanine(966)-N(2))-methyltransferase RsmD [Candidatus Omnitrophota bacterium]HPS37487.1 16S rRNA (guanine(966)-N(2))-methyltransferase RsmD [Candidatus Omnitrophota bacterium]